MLVKKKVVSKKDIAVNGRVSWILRFVSFAFQGLKVLLGFLFLCLCELQRLLIHITLAQAVAAVMKAAGPERLRYSAHQIADGILHWYSTSKQMPRGISPNCSAVRDWALRTGIALRRLVGSSVVKQHSSWKM